MTPSEQKLLRSLPSVDALSAAPLLDRFAVSSGKAAVMEAVRVVLEEARAAVQSGDGWYEGKSEQLVERVIEKLSREQSNRLRRVVNATGIVLHTGLGRAPLAEAAVEAIAESAGRYTNLELELTGGRRGKRSAHVADRLCRVTGAPAATIVNNNAAATLLILSTVAGGREVVVSRGQLIEIGGSYRLPDIMQASGAILKEVGTTNRTRLSDYRNAIGQNTAALMHVHTSNYRIVGFTEQVDIADLVKLAHDFDLVAIDDLGSGALFDFSAVGLPDEPNVQASLAAGADLVCFSGDKLLGGPQAGIILGRPDLVERIEANPMMRAMRVGKLTLLAMDATLRLYEDPRQAVEHVPTLAMLSGDLETLKRRAARLKRALSKALPEETFVQREGESFAGGGSLPACPLKTAVVCWQPSKLSANDVAARLRCGEPAVLARIDNDEVVFDARTLRDDEIAEVARACAAAG